MVIICCSGILVFMGNITVTMVMLFRGSLLFTYTTTQHSYGNLDTRYFILQEHLITFYLPTTQCMKSYVV